MLPRAAGRAGPRSRARVAHAAVGVCGLATLLAGAVVAVSALLHDVGAASALGWVVALAATGWTLAALRVALWTGGPLRDCVRTGAALAALLCGTTLAVTSSDLHARWVAVLGALFLIRLGLPDPDDEPEPTP